MTRVAKRSLQLAAGLAGAGILMAIAARGVNWPDVGAALATAKPLWLVGALLLSLFHYVVRAVRWRLLLEPLRRSLPLRPLLDAIVVGYMVTFVIPGRLGEIVRPAYLSRTTGVPFLGTLATVGLDRLLDGMALVSLLLAYTLLAPQSGPGALTPVMAGHLERAAWLFAGVLAILLPALWILARARGRIAAGGGPASGWARRQLVLLLEGLASLQGIRSVAGTVAYSLAIWVVLSGQAWCSLKAFGIDLPFTSAFVLVSFLALGIAIPLPAGVGGFHALGQFCLVQVFGVDPDPAFAAILVLHLISVVPTIVLGGWVVLRSGLSPLRLASGAPRASDLSAAAAPAAPAGVGERTA
jgi:uncharacterized membrane protein YbhN (UPF0104 family)